MGVSALDSLGLQPASSATTTPQGGASVLVTEAIAQEQSLRSQPKAKSGASALNFRALLDATTFNGLTQSTDDSTTDSDNASPRASKVPDASPAELSETESSGLLGAAQAARAQSNAGTSASQIYRAATSQYAQAFFADSGAFARPGDSLEMMA